MPTDIYYAGCDDVGSYIDQVVDMSLALLRAAMRFPDFKRAVIISSSTAVAPLPRPVDTTLTGEDYNETSIAIANSLRGKSEKPPLYEYHTYAASKALADKACLRFVAENQVRPVAGS
jgi:nucleoside-diphosphate-sugar epimerase